MADQFRFRITRLSNAAFAEDRKAEIARLLRETADRIEVGEQTTGTLFDYNGSEVGDFGVVPRR